MGPAAPPRREEGSTGTYQRRKFVAKTHTHFGKTPSRARHVKMATVQRALDEDSAAVETLKRDVADFQNLELETSRRYLVSLQKTYDKLRSEADAREQQQHRHEWELATLDKTCAEARLASSAPAPELQQLQQEIEREEHLVRESVVQKDVFGHVISRISNELLSSRRRGRALAEQLETCEREISGCTLQLQTARQESKHEELQYERLSARVAARRKMQESRLDGIQRVIAERSSLVEKQEERMKMREAVMARSKFDLGAQEEQRLKRMHIIRKVYSSMLEKKITAEEESLGALETTFQKIKIVTGLSDVDEIVQKFKDRTQKTQQLHRLADDVRARIDSLRDDNASLRERLVSLRSTHEAASGNREIYREMDSFNKGLGKALKDCDDAKDRAIRSNVTLEQLKLAVARFRSKIEGKSYPTPDTNQLPEYLRELDVKLTVMMKSVSEALALEDTACSGGTQQQQGPPPPDKAQGPPDNNHHHHHHHHNSTTTTTTTTKESQQQAGSTTASDAGSLKSTGNEVLLPFGKLQSEKLQKMLYHKLMLTTPDQGPRNVRVRARPGVQDLERYAQRKLMTQGLESDRFDAEDDTSEFAYPTDPQHQEDDDIPRRPEATTKEDEIREAVVDRNTVKRLSTLIVSREEPKKRRGKHADD
ncbi:hypothetical protein CTAYLR_008809 [Chrysophaeum taylorii]|uniref:Coiled-coil domain-containing protein 151 n=1 Tax=Chrysophaeum taylorii TaxID=2483200 RepID=A0AAD7UBX1_9STRA|nr:hypothetical protein CTAYLR_008809 [Chrysophaeum taylorii]